MLRNCSVQNLDDNFKRKIDFLLFLKQKGKTTLITNRLLLNMNDIFSNPTLIQQQEVVAFLQYYIV